MRINSTIREAVAFFGLGDTVAHHDRTGIAERLVVPALMGALTGTCAAGLACIAIMTPGVAPSAWAVGITAALGWTAGFAYTRAYA